jgi:hypothetical protein
MGQVLEQAAWRNRGQLFGDYAEFHVAEQDVRYWSPHLAVHLEPEGDQRSWLLGRFAPRQNVWMLVWIVYLAMTFVVFFAGIGAGVQYWMGQVPWASAAGLVAVLLIVALHAISKTGQSWSNDQMVELRQRLDQLLAECQIPAQPIP